MLQTVKALLWTLLFCYAPLAYHTLRLWDCTEIGSTFHLRVDYAITCDNAEYKLYSVWAAVSAIMYLFGIPALIASLVSMRRARNVDQYLQHLAPRRVSNKPLHLVCLH